MSSTMVIEYFKTVMMNEYSELTNKMSDVSGETGKETCEDFPEITDNFPDRKKLPHTAEN